MEKFTVDIDKVLDDFEFNEDRASEIPSTSCCNNSNTKNVQFSLPPSYEETMCYGTQNDTSYYKKTSQQSDVNNIFPKNTNNSCNETYLPPSNLERYNVQQYDPPSYDSLQYSTYTNTSSYFNNKPQDKSINFVLRNDELYSDQQTNHVVTPTTESFSTEMLKIRLFKDGNKNDKNSYATVNNSNEQLYPKNHFIKKNSVSNVFNSLQEYINTDVVDVVTLPESNIQKNNLTYPLLPKIENGEINVTINNTIENQNLLDTEVVEVTSDSSLIDETTSNSNNFIITTTQEEVESIQENLITNIEQEGDDDDVIVPNSTKDPEKEPEIVNIEESVTVTEEIAQPPKNNVDCEDEHTDMPQNTQVISEEEIISKPIGFDNITIEVSDAEIDDYLKDLEEIEESVCEEHIEEKPELIDDKTIITHELENKNMLETNNSETIIENVTCEVKKVVTQLVDQVEAIYERRLSQIEENQIENLVIEKIPINSSTLEQTENEANEKLYTEKLQTQNNENEEEKETLKEQSSDIHEETVIKTNENTEIEKTSKEDDLTENTEQIVIESNENVPEMSRNELIEETSVEQVCELQKPPKLSTICRPNSLDIVSSIDDEDSIVIKGVGPPGETPMCNTTTLSMEDKEDEENSPNDETCETSRISGSIIENTSGFSPSTSEVSSVENQEDGVLLDESRDNQVIEYDNHSTLGKRPPYWIPDTDTNNCMHCGFKFTVIKRRHHCRACGMVLCSKCCNMKAKLEYLGNIVSRVCIQCYEVLNKDVNSNNQDTTSSDSANNSPAHFSNQGQPNPNNPMEYCSTVPPLKQIENQRPRSPPTVMVPVGVLKRQGSNKARSEKTVMFSDGIRPGCDLTELDNSWESRPIRRQNKRVSTPPGQITTKINRNLPSLDETTLSYIPSNDSCLPPTVNFSKPENTYTECSNNESVVEMLRNEILVFAVQRNFNVYVKIVNLDCCVNKQVWCFTTKGLSSVGQDEIVILLEVLEKENQVPKDVFLHLNNIYIDASKGNTITEMGFSIENKSNFLDSKNHAGFLYVRPTYQCLQSVILPDAPYLFGILIHRWETPWVKIFPLRLLLRLGAEYRYYPCPIISTRNRESVFVEIGHTIINLLADFRNYSYTLPSVRGLIIHMEEKKTSVLIPKNRYDQVMRAMNNSSDHILAFAGNFSSEADSHLVCIQDTGGSNDNAYSTHAINIQNKPRKVTGASFIILNGALKTTSGLTAKSSVIEDGLMIQILPDQMVKLRDNLRNMKNFEISCGCVNSETDEYVNIIWTENDVNFNIGVKSPIDNQAMDGVPSIRVHNGVDHIGSSKLIRWTEVFILQSGDENPKTQDPVDISKLSESISRSTCDALVKYLDLLATNNFTKVGIRVTLHSENVSYEAGSNGIKFAPIYMNSLDNALIPVLHNITSKNIGNDPIILELIFHILNS